MGQEHLSSRRAVLKKSLAAIAAGAAGRLPVFGASADRALVCIYLVGGNDSNNMIVPLDQYSSYAAARGSLALPQNDLLPVTVEGGAPYGFHPALSELRDLFDARVLGVIGNVGSLETKAHSRPRLSARLIPHPPDFLSHGDRSVGYLPEGFLAPAWALSLGGIERSVTRFPSSFPSGRRGGTSLIALGGPSGSELAGIVQARLRNAPPLRTQFPATRLAEQLRQIAQLAATSGLQQQVYLVPLSVFDTTANQMPQQRGLFRQLSEAMAAFYEATMELGIARSVTTFTDTEFNRTLLPNQNSGTGPGWGGHHLVMGGSVLGGAVHGEFPALVVNGPDDATGDGVWAPSVAKDEFSGTLAEWLGVDVAGSRHLFPALEGSAPSTLRFLA